MKFIQGLETEVLLIMAHLLITVTLLGSYVFLRVSGYDDTTLENLLLIVGGYWFGAVGGQQMKKNLQEKRQKDSDE